MYIFIIYFYNYLLFTYLFTIIFIHSFSYVIIHYMYLCTNLLTFYIYFFFSLGSGLSLAQKRICDGFLYLPQYGIGGTGSLNVSVATTLVLHRYTLWQAAEIRNTGIEKEKGIPTIFCH
jgi:hypothetical protein